MDEKKNGEGKEENISRRKISYFTEEKKNGEGKGETYLEKENIFFLRRRKKRIRGRAHIT